MKRINACLLLVALGAFASTGFTRNAGRLAPVSALPEVRILDASSSGRTLQTPDGAAYQWPGVYFEAAFDSRIVFFKVGPGDVILHVSIDGAPAGTLVKPKPGTWQVDRLRKGRHVIRVEAVTESESAPNIFGGFLVPAESSALAVTPRRRQVEFIGDSHTAGYGNTSETRNCSEEEVWSTTDTSATFGPRVARHYDADYQVNAISGRGIVRNYDGSEGDPLPVAYPFVLLDHGARFENASWQPQVIVIALGTNDFSTPLRGGEKWATREALHEDFETTYVRFLEELRARNPQALIVLWATELADREIQTEAGKVVAQRQSAGDERITFIPIDGLAMSGCHWHPSLADDITIAAKLIDLIDARDPWGGR
jgi:lysophospholipase L1-like esterase